MNSLLHRAYSVFLADGIFAVIYKVIRYLFWEVIQIYRIYRTTGFGPATGELSERILSKNLYLLYIAWRSDDGTILLTDNHLITDGYSLYVDTRDEGMGKGLLMRGGWELRSTQAFPRVLENLLEEQKDDVTFLEVGANFGYYTLLAANTLGDRADIIAFEPSPVNRSLLERNVDENGYSDQIEIYPYAIGSEETAAELGLATKANCSQIVSDRGKLDVEIIDTVEVDVIPIDKFIETNGMEPGEVDVIRMDVQGYEGAIIDGMKSVLESEAPIVIFLETHPEYITENEQSRLAEILTESGFEVVHVSQNHKLIDINSIEEILNESVEVILKR